MPIPTLVDRFYCTVSGTPGTGTFTLSTAVTGYAGSSALTNAQNYYYTATDGTNWETGIGTYTSSGTTFSRDTIYQSSNSGSKASFGSGTSIFITPPAELMNNVPLNFITGLLVTKHSGANSLDISAGYCFDPSSGKVLNYAGATAVSAGTLGDSQWNQVYLYDNAGTPTVEVVNNADPPSTTYAGNARKGGTNGGRWIGCFLTDSSGNIYNAIPTETAANQVTVTYTGASQTSAPFRLLSAGTSATYSLVSAAGVAPNYVSQSLTIVLYVGTSGAGTDAYAGTSIDNSSSLIFSGGIDGILASGIYPRTTFVQPLLTNPPSFYYLVGTSSVSPVAYIDTIGYIAAR